eukprot:8221406-Heterocapsa_arctica.AAC.1
MYGRQLLPQSTHENPFAEQNHQMTDEADDNTLTSPPPINTQTTQTHNSENQPENNLEAQNSQNTDPTKPKTWMDNDPMRGIKYPPLSGPGPSGFRPEFITDLMTVRKKCVTRRLKKTLSTFFRKAGRGELPDEMRWILGSGGKFLEQPGKNNPRLIRSGEWWAKSGAKSVLRDNK